MKRAVLADGTILNFPDQTEDSVIDRAVSEYISDKNVPTSEFGKGAGAATYGLQATAAKFFGETAERLGLPSQDLQDLYTKWSAEAAKRQGRVPDIGSIHSLNDFADWLSNTIGQVIPSIGAGVALTAGGALAAGVAGATAPVAAAAGLGAGAVGLLPSMAGANLERQEKEGAEENYGAALGTGVAQSLIEQVGGPTGRLIRKLAAGSVDSTLGQIAKKSLGQTTKETAVGRFTQEALKSAREEAIEEVAQGLLERLQAGIPIGNVGALEEYANQAAAGAVGGLLFGGPVSLVGNKQKPKEEAPFSSVPPDGGVQAQASLQGMYSPSVATLDNLKLDKAPASQWEATLKNLPGVKQEEMWTTGVYDWLAEQKGPVTKADLTKFINDNQVPFEEQVRSGSPLKIEDVLTPEEFFDYERLLERSGDQAGGLTLLQVNRFEELRNKYFNAQQTRKSPKYSQYSLPEGTNYKETQFRLPGKLDFPNHAFSEKDTLFWTRQQDIEVDGKKQRVLIEAQGDPVQNAEKYGIRTPEDEKEIARLNDYINSIAQHARALRDALKFPNLSVENENEIREKLKSLNAIENGLEVQLRPLESKSPPIPHAKSWAEFAWRHSLLRAAQDGMDGFAWVDAGTSAEVQDHDDQRTGPFYDKRLVNYANSFAKRWGVRVGKLDLPINKNKYTTNVIGLGSSEDFWMSNVYAKIKPFIRQNPGLSAPFVHENYRNSRLGKLEEYFQNRSVNQETLDKFNEAFQKAGIDFKLEAKFPKRQLNHIPITPKMREDLLGKGVPTFSLGQQQVNENKTVEGTLRQLRHLLGAAADNVEIVGSIDGPMLEKIYRDFESKTGKKAAPMTVPPGSYVGGLTIGAYAWIATRASDSSGIIAHESWHVLENIGAITSQDISTLMKNEPTLGQIIAKAMSNGFDKHVHLPTVLNADPTEKRAYALQAYAFLKRQGLDTGIKPKVKTILQKALDTLLRLAQIFVPFKNNSPLEVAAIFDKFLAGGYATKVPGAKPLNHVDVFASLSPTYKTQWDDFKSYLNDTWKTPAPKRAAINRFSQLLNSMYHLARTNPLVAEVFRPVRDRVANIRNINNEVWRALEDYSKASKEDKQIAYDMAVAGRFSGKNWQPGTTITNELEYDLPSAKAKSDFAEPTPGAWKAYRSIIKWNEALHTQILKSLHKRLIALDPARFMQMDADQITPELMAELVTRPEYEAQREELVGIQEKLISLKTVLQDRPYVPLPRIGNYIVNVFDHSQTWPDGTPLYNKAVWTETFEISGLDKRAATARMNRRIAEIRQKFPESKGFIVKEPVLKSRDVVFKNMSEKLLDGLDALTNFAGDPDSKNAIASLREQYSEVIKQSGKPAFLRPTKWIGGFDTTQNVTALANATHAFSTWLANAEMRPEVNKALTHVRTKDPDLSKFLERYIDEVMSPEEDFQRLKQLTFLWILSDFSAAAMQLSQFLPMGAMLTAIGGKQALKDIAWATKTTVSAFSKDAAKSSQTDIALDLEKLRHLDQRFPQFAVRRHDGTLSPLLTAEGIGFQTFGDNILGKAREKTTILSRFASKGFGSMEVVNRTTAYLAAYKLFSENEAIRAKGLEFFGKNELFKQDLGELINNPYNAGAVSDLLARYVVEETQFMYGKHSRNELMRGPMGSLFFQFQSYSISMLEFIWTLAKNSLDDKTARKAFTYFMVGMLLTSGFWGLPLAENAKNIIQMLYHFATKKRINLDYEIRSLGNELVGNDVTDATMRGAFRLMGLNIGRRIGMGDVPLIGQMLNIMGYGSAANALEAPFLSVLGGTLGFEEAMRKGAPLSAALSEVLPKPLSNIAQAQAWSVQGVRSMTDAPVVSPEELDTIDYILKGAGFTSTKVAKLQEERRAKLDVRDPAADLRQSYYTRLARLDAAVTRARREGDQAEVASLQEAIKELFKDVMDHNKSARPNEVIRIRPETRKQNLREELEGARALRVPKRSRPAIAEVEEAYE